MVQVITSREVPGDREAVFGVLADYRRRPALFPSSFTDYTVKRGGQGTGTLVRYRLHIGPPWRRGARECHMEITEPIPGRVLDEHDTHSSLRTRWSVQPAGAGYCRVHVETRWTGASGLDGWVERTITTWRLARTYRDVLNRLAHQMSS